MKCAGWMWFVGACGVVHALVGCGSSDVDAAGDAGGVGDGDGDGDGPSATFECGGTTCYTPQLDPRVLPLPLQAILLTMPELLGEFALEGCCVEGGQSPCGVSNGNQCIEQDQEGVADDTCPGSTIMGGGAQFSLEVAGCCKPSSNRCGFDLALVGAGCIERSEAASMSFMGMGLPGASDIESIPCGGIKGSDPDEQDTDGHDAGMQDADAGAQDADAGL